MRELSGTLVFLVLMSISIYNAVKAVLLLPMIPNLAERSAVALIMANLLALLVLVLIYV